MSKLRDEDYNALIDREIVKAHQPKKGVKLDYWLGYLNALRDFKAIMWREQELNEWERWIDKL